MILALVLAAWVLCAFPVGTFIGYCVLSEK
jgi:hypothetical protein